MNYIVKVKTLKDIVTLKINNFFGKLNYKDDFIFFSIFDFVIILKLKIILLKY